MAESEPADEAFPELVGTTRRLAQVADVPPPTVRVRSTDRPESYTLGGRGSATIVVSSGMIEALSRDELEAVLAHEVSHVANGDSRIMGAALTPVSIVDDWMDDDPSDLEGVLQNAFFLPWKRYAQFGVAVLSRGREWAADAGAVAITGSPASLASALLRLDEARGRPTTDLRAWEESVAALDILPPGSEELAVGPFRTHPPTEERIERLERLAARAERR